MGTDILKKILDLGIQSGVLPAKQQDARQWFRTKGQQVTSINPQRVRVDNIPANILKGQTPTTTPMIGSMYMFAYDPKLKKTLPYYDRLPLIFPIEYYSDGILGINFHYLAPTLRATLMDALYPLASDDKFDQKTRLRISYGILKSASRYKYFQPCVKRYLFSHIQSKFFPVPPSQWDIALFLPLERFEKASAAKVQSESIKKIRK